MTATRAPQTVAVLVELNRVGCRREELLRAAPSPTRSELIADQFDHEAWLWSLIFERTTSPILWRAALGAQAHARMCARWWRSRPAGAYGGAA